MANTSPSFIDNLFRNSYVGSSISNPAAKQHADDIREVGNFLNGEFEKIERTSRNFTDAFINRSMKDTVDVRTGEDLVRNIDILDGNIRIVDNKVRGLDRSIRTHTSLLEYNKKLMERTNGLIEKWIRDGTHAKFSDIENKMELSHSNSALNSAIDDRIARRLAGQMSAVGGGAGGGMLGNLAAGRGAAAATAAISTGVSSSVGGVVSAIGAGVPIAGAGLLALLKKSLPIAAASALAYVIATPEGQQKAIEFARYLDQRNKELTIEKKVAEGQAAFERRMQEEYRRRFAQAIGIGLDKPVTITDLPPLPGTSVVKPAAPKLSVPLTVFGGYRQDQLDLDYDGSNQVPTPVVPKPGDRMIPSLPYNENNLVPTPVVPKPGDTFLPSIEDTVVPNLGDMGASQYDRPYRVNVASLGNGLESLSSEQMNSLFGGSVTSSPRFGMKSYAQNISEEKAAATETKLNDFIEQYNLYMLKAKIYDLTADKALFDVKETFEIDATSITIKAKQKLILSAPIIEIAGKIVHTKEPLGGSYNSGGFSPGGPGGSSPGFMPNSSILGNNIGPGAGSFSPGLPSLGNNPGSSGTGVGNVPMSSPNGVMPLGTSGKDESRLAATGPDGKPFAPTDNSNAAMAYRYFKSKGYSDHHAAAIVGNLMAESGPNLDINARGDSGNAYGIAQWNLKYSPDRFANFKKVYGIELWDSTIEQQLEFIDWELHNSEKRAGERFFATENASGAAAVFDQYYERSDGTHRDTRIANANEVLGKSEAMTAGLAPGLPAGVISGPTQLGVGDLDTIPEDHLDLIIKTDNGNKTLRELGITKYSELETKGGQVFGGGDNNPATTYAMAEIAEGLGPNFNRVTAQNDHSHQGTGSGHTQGHKGDFTVQGISYPDATAKTREILEGMGLIDGVDFKLIDEATNPSARSSGDHIDLNLTPSGQAKVNEIRQGQVVEQIPMEVATKGNRDGSAPTAANIDPRLDTGQKPVSKPSPMTQALEEANKPRPTPPPPRQANVDKPAIQTAQTHTNTHDKKMLSAKSLVNYASSRIA